MKFFKGDLHIHTCLSPCADLDMSPKKIIEKSKEEKLEIIGICDHNTIENLKPTISLGKKNNIFVLPGMEVTTKEEVHLLCFFKDLEIANLFQKIVYDNLENLKEERLIEDQIIVDEEENVLGFCEKALFSAVNLNIEKIVEIVHSYEGIVIASHIDREAFSIIGQLGFIPENLSLDGLEIAFELKNEYKKFNLPLIKSSDSHYLHQIGKRFTEFYLEDTNFEEIIFALKNKLGRKIRI